MSQTCSMSCSRMWNTAIGYWNAETAVKTIIHEPNSLAYQGIVIINDHFITYHPHFRHRRPFATKMDRRGVCVKG